MYKLWRRLTVKNGHLNNPMDNDTGLSAQNVDIILGSTKLGGGVMTLHSKRLFNFIYLLHLNFDSETRNGKL